MSITRALGWTALVVAAVATGVIATRPVMQTLLNHSMIQAGPWRTTLSAGSAEANIYERAAIAIAGLYALSRQETLYYTAFVDSDGQPLDGRCDYRLRGLPLPARWWSLTMYGAEHYLVPNSADLYSRHADNLEFEADGSFYIPVSAQAQSRNWLPAPDDGEFSITARLYNPDPAVFRDLSAVALPEIRRGACR